MPRPSVRSPNVLVEEPVFNSVQEKTDVIKKMQLGNMMYLLSPRNGRLEQKSFQVSALHTKVGIVSSIGMKKFNTRFLTVLYKYRGHRFCSVVYNLFNSRRSQIFKFVIAALKRGNF